MKKSLPHDAYDELADSYAAEIDTKPHNAYYDRPAVQSLIPDVKGLTILDAGCGTGVYIEWLIERGAAVTGIEANEKMLRHARSRNGDKAAFVHANLEEPLTFLESGSFDGIVSALTVTYVEDHAKLFAEFFRVLKPGGWFVFSTEHPFFDYKYHKLDDYFPTRRLTTTWKWFGRKIEMKSYYHSLGSICESLTGNGFLIDAVLEPKPVKAFEKADPENYAELMKFPLFICFRAVKP